MFSNNVATIAALALLSSLAVAAPTARDASTAQIQCKASYFGAGDGGAGLLLVDSGVDNATAHQGNGPSTLVGRSSSSGSTTPLVVDANTADTYRFYECSSTSLGVQSREYDEHTGFSNYYGLVVLQHGTEDDGLLAGNGQCIQTSTAPPEEDHSSAKLVIAPCSLDDTAYTQDRQFFRFPGDVTSLYFRGNTQFPNFLDGHGLQNGDQVSVQQGTSENQYNGFQFVDTD